MSCHLSKTFDAVVVATGRYNAPNVPNISGIKDWNDRFPGHIIHSCQYRRPESMANKTVLVIGAASSGGEISRDLITNVKTIYQSIRPQNAPLFIRQLEVFLRRLPKNVTLVGEIKRFHPPASEFSQGQVELMNGTIITGIDQIIFTTGYRYNYPFLPQFRNSGIDMSEDVSYGAVQPIVTDGTHLRSLYLDVFYIPDPTLTFVNANHGMQSFTYAEFTSLAVAKVWAGKADLPLTSELWRKFLGAEKTNQNIRFFLGWLNNAAVKYGGRQIDSLSKDVDQISATWTTARFTRDDGVDILNAAGIPSNLAQNKGILEDGATPWELESIFSDYWSL
ncbi:Flavin-containing monooxygenase ustF2 [Psilocybe cubensis]|uniref:Flavin-containing monooxygenase ustF2 n=2 Tax=Psilocybe cubensis TaxID=181762 RepID=A0ACB8GJ31_PSICU|nr:Flavin-containing monooxygenase ustF2 [Psilocybe cubensis]KAH9475713.1 Flavin-containing monooxygenase ustF2 [Psilocybe cubensis]